MLSAAAYSNSEWMVTAALFDPAFVERYRTQLDERLILSGGPLRQVFSLAIEQHDEHGDTEIALIVDKLVGAGMTRTDATLMATQIAGWINSGLGRAAMALHDLSERQVRMDAQVRIKYAHAVSLSGISNSELADHLSAISEEIRGRAVVKLRTLADVMESDPSADSEQLIYTGLKWWDNIQPLGAMAIGDKIAIAARPGGGKSALALQITLGALIQNPQLSALWLLCEMGERTIRNRALQCISGLSSDLLRRDPADLSEFQAEKRAHAIDTARELGERLTLLPPIVTPSRVEAALLNTGARLMVVDYLQLVKSDRDLNNRRDEIDDVVRSFTAIAQGHGVASLWLSAMPKTGVANPDLYTIFKESSEIAHQCDQGYYMHTIGEDDLDAEHADVVNVHLCCRKSRHGSPLSANLRFDRPAQQFGAIK